jgi:vacuolar-type H+-ATPase catalytic subunit A/Vma1
MISYIFRLPEQMWDVPPHKIYDFAHEIQALKRVKLGSTIGSVVEHEILQKAVVVYLGKRKHFS